MPNDYELPLRKNVPPDWTGKTAGLDTASNEILEAELVRHNVSKAHGVPQRFGLSALLALMAVFSGVFGFLRYVNAPAPVYLFLGSMAAVTGLAQMRFGGVPRAASVCSGAVFLPVFWIGSVLVMEATSGHRYRESIPLVILGAPCMMVGGAILGYLIGTVVAGVFLLANMWEQRGRKPTPQDTNSNGPFT